MRASLLLIGSYYRRRWLSSVVTAMFLVVFAAAVVFMGLLWPSFRYHHTATAQAAQWDLRVNGPITEDDLESIRSAAGVQAAEMVTVNKGGLTALSRGNERFTFPGDLYVVDASAPGGFSRSVAPAPLVIQGSLGSSDSAGMDWVTLRSIGGKLGDTISYEQVYTSWDGERFAVQGSARITAVLSTTAQLRGLVIAETPELRRVLREAVGVVASDVYLVTDAPERVAGSIANLENASEWIIWTREEFQRMAMATADGAGARSYGMAGLMVAVVLFAVLLLRDIFVRMARRRQSLATAYSLGLRSNFLVAAHMIEQAIILGVTSVGGFFAGQFFFVSSTGLYPPQAAVHQMTLLWLLVSLTLLATCASQVLRLTRESSLLAHITKQGE